MPALVSNVPSGAGISTLSPVHVVIGGAAALGRPMPVVGAMALVGVSAIFHGHAHDAEIPEDTANLLYAVGFLMATTCLHLAGIAAALGTAKLVGRFGRLVAQVVVGMFALGGVGVLLGWL